MKRKTWRKNIAILLVIAMMMTIMPMAAFAEDEPEATNSDSTPTPIVTELVESQETPVVDSSLEEEPKADLDENANEGENPEEIIEETPVGEVTLDELVAELGLTDEDLAMLLEEMSEEDAVVYLQQLKDASLQNETGEIAETTVAMINDVQYETLEAAIAAANEAADSVITISVIKDCTINGLNVNDGKSITLSCGGNSIVNDGQNGWKVNKDSNLIIDNGNVSIDSTSITLSYSGAANLTLQNGSALYMDGEKKTGGYYATAIVLGNLSNSITIDNSTLEIVKFGPGVKGGAIKLDAKATTPTARINIVNNSVVTLGSTEATDKSLANYSGFINTMDIYVTDSTLNVCNNSGNGSNGAHYYLNNAIVNYNGNGSHGLSTGIIEATDSKITCNDNGYTGFHVGQTLKVDGNTEINISGNSYKTWDNDLFAGLRLTGNATIGEGAVIKVTDNYGVGIRANTANTEYNIDENATVIVTGNGKPIANGTQYNTIGGGIWNKGNMTLPSKAIIYNNHATNAGDDIYSTGTVTFGPVGSDWKLDGDVDDIGCAHPIDGWYDDSVDARWDAHNEDKEALHVDEVEAGTLEGVQALKAAHGVLEYGYDITCNYYVRTNGILAQVPEYTTTSALTYGQKDETVSADPQAYTVLTKDGKTVTYTYMSESKEKVESETLTDSLLERNNEPYHLVLNYVRDVTSGGGSDDPIPIPTPTPKPNPNPNPTPVTPIPDPEVPQGEPEEEITEPDVPTTDVPGEVVTEVVDTPVPLGEAPATGDSSNAFAFAMVLLVAGLGLVVTRRKFN